MKYKSIQQYLRISGKTEREFADMLGISQPFVNELKNGGKCPSPALAFKIEAETGIPFRNLYAGQEVTAERNGRKTTSAGIRNAQSRRRSTRNRSTGARHGKRR